MISPAASREGVSSDGAAASAPDCGTSTDQPAPAPPVTAATGDEPARVEPICVVSYGGSRWRLVRWDQHDSGDPWWQEQDRTYACRWYDRHRANPVAVVALNEAARQLATALSSIADHERELERTRLELEREREAHELMAAERDGEIARLKGREAAWLEYIQLLVEELEGTSALAFVHGYRYDGNGIAAGQRLRALLGLDDHNQPITTSAAPADGDAK